MDAIVWTEGKTDWQHMKRAFQLLGAGERIAFHEAETDFGDDQLFKQCVALAHIPQQLPTIFIFDRDTDEIVRKVEAPSGNFKAWGNNVYSFAIPIPPHRNDQTTCIEFYYKDEELCTLDEAGRRLFISTEFHPPSGRHVTNPSLSVGNRGKLPRGENASRPRIIDSEVFDDKMQNVALSKADFANNVLIGRGSFSGFSFEAFKPILDIINEIVEEAQEKINLPFGELESYLGNIKDAEPSQQFAAIVRAIIRICKLSAITFSAATLRFYEQRITGESGVDVKKVKPIKHLLAGSFGHPGLVTLQKLARHCYHLVDEKAPSEIHTLRAVMAANPVLGPVGDVLDDLETLFGAPRVRVINKSQLRKPILDYIISEFAKYEGRMQELSESSFLDSLRNADLNRWQSALTQVIEWFSALQTLPFRVRTLERVRNDSDAFDVLLTTFRDSHAVVETTTQSYQDFKDDRMETYELLIGTDEGGTFLDLFPFVVIKDDRLHYYHRTRAHGFEYRSIFGSTGYIELTKRKFSHAALRTTKATDLQGLFWTQVTPTVNSLGVRANIPVHGTIVGRTQQITTIMEEILQIPNQNGIIYGPGGVGKTALLIELSRQLFEEQTTDQADFENIIWVSAKRDYYDPILDVKEAREPQFQSLDNVLTAILEFKEFEDAVGYEAELKKGLVLESLRDEKTLLVLDNFESVARKGQEEIIRFLSVEAKQALKDKPDHFKVLITSREMIPSSFHQIKLKGLDKKESKQLMQRLYETYARSGKQQLTEEQIDALYEATQGIPLIIKHCYGQIYEYNRSVDQVLRNLRTAGIKVVDFSFEEIFNLLKQDNLQLRTILVLELSGRRLMLRQIADILKADESEIEERLTQLVNFQCINRINVGADEKYVVSDEVRLLTRRLAQEHPTASSEIVRQIADLAIEKRMDYTGEEYEAFLTFQDYVSQEHYLIAEDFIKERLKEHPNSVLLNMHYAKYLKQFKRRTEEAIERLERIRVPSGNDQQVLRLLMEYYVALDIPNFEHAFAYAVELEDIAVKNKEIKKELAQFYIAWSTSLKMKVELDPLKEMVRQQKYKELADAAIKQLKDIALGTREWHHLLAQSYYNRWDNELALKHIDKALEGMSKKDYLYGPYQRLKSEVLRKLELYDVSVSGRWYLRG